MKKICFFSGDITRSGGTERVSTIIANELVRQGQYEICFLSLCEQKENSFFAIDERIKRHKLGEKWIQPGPGYLPLIPKIRKFLKQKEIDLIIDIDIVLDSLSIPASVGLKTKVLSWEHSNCFYEMSVLYRKLILKFSVRNSDYVVTLTEGDKNNYANMLKRTNCIEAIYNPMEEVNISEEDIREKWIITVGHLISGKGPEYIAQAAKKVLPKNPDWKWYIVGEGEEREYLEKFIQENGLEKQMILTGLVNNVGEYLSKSKIFVLTSKSEGLPMCLLEAKAYGVPSISFDIPTGPNEIIDDGINGYLVKPFDCEDLANKVNELISDDNKWSSFAKNTQQNMSKFSMESIMEKWNRVLSSLCE